MRIFGGIAPATGKQLILTGSAMTEDDAIALRDGFARGSPGHTAVRANVTLRVLLAEWLAGHQVEPKHPRPLHAADRHIHRARARQPNGVMVPASSSDAVRVLSGGE